jgi:hypothetical protein
VRRVQVQVLVQVLVLVPVLPLLEPPRRRAAA